ncbi:hypothetical protein ACFOD4_10795 [Pseudoroseomonas globiformis]|uniref:Uncharacterized protein n=1 Tax=Teichococcus globiformis TaxID=2307229 RepID=A0ABV7G1J3_9PROT
MLLTQCASLSPKDLSPESIAEWLAQAEQIMEQFSPQKSAPVPDPAAAKKG